MNTTYNGTISNIEKINDHFKLPISYNDKKMSLNANIITDLELIQTLDASSNPIYNYVFQPKTKFGEKILEQFVTHYTTDNRFLKDSQLLLKKYKPLNEKYNLNNIIDIWDEIKNDNGFKDKYQYINWPFWEFLNNSDTFLQFLSIYNLSSPIISFLVPVFILIVPFFIIKLKGITLSLNEYIGVLKVISSNHAIGKLFTQFNSVKLEEKIYLLVSAFFYIFSIYQNLLTCIYFNQNMIKIHNYFDDLKKYITYSIENMKNLLSYTSKLISYSDFNDCINENISTLNKFYKNIENISPYKLSLNKVFQFGNILKYFYELYDDETYNKAFLYSFGFNGYIDNLEGIICNINLKQINFCKLSKKKTNFKNSYYPNLINKNPVLNNIEIDKNIIITGPNASGKTTILKSTLINIIISQQMGCGFYSKSKLKPFKYIHCYLNIPDTSGRDSLFQAEARRCKDIIDIIEDYNSDSHFCVFDELYSGTNPLEAVVSASAFMNYLVKYKNVKCILTTHFIEICKILEKNKYFINYMMNTDFDKDKITFNYTYKLIKGISNIKGGIKVLKDMNYPREIIDNCNSYS
jgi:hypothetical protein